MYTPYIYMYAHVMRNVFAHVMCNVFAHVSDIYSSGISLSGIESTTAIMYFTIRGPFMVLQILGQLIFCNLILTWEVWSKHWPDMG